MDRFSEQLVIKCSTGRDTALKALIVAGTFIILGALVFLFLLFGTLAISVAASAGAVWCAVWLLRGFYTEYEYIVTNDDLDIDRINGKRKRKRLITISLSSVTEIGEYNNDTNLSPDVTVMAHDCSGTDMWYLISETDSYGTLAVIFNPDERTIENIVGGMAPKNRFKYSSLIKDKELTEEENTDTDTDTDTEND